MPLRILFGVALILACTVLVYAPGLSGGFVFDDFVNIVDNPGLRVGSPTPSSWLGAAFASEAGPLARPLSMLTFAVEIHAFGLDPGPMKVTNLGIHLLNAVLVFLLLSTLLSIYRERRPEAFAIVTPASLSLLVTAAWALAPINLTAVLFVVQRMESLSTLFMLLGLLAYTHGRRLMEADDAGARGWRWIFLGLLGCGSLAVLSKESGVMLPVYALIIEGLVFGWGAPGSQARKNLVRLYTFVLLLPGLAGLAWLTPSTLSGAAFVDRPFTLSERLWTESRVIWDYLAWIVAPSPATLSLYHDAYPISRGPLAPATSLLGALGLATLLVVAIALRKRATLFSLGVFWFLTMHLLVSTVLSLELVFEHRNYMGSIGVFLAIFALIFTGRNAARMKVACYAITLAAIALYAILTLLRANEWSDPLKLAYFENSRHPESPRAAYDLGLILTKASPPPGSIGFATAIRTFKYAASLPRTSLLPHQALLFMHGKHRLSIPDSWWENTYAYIENRPLSAQDTNALHALLTGQMEGVIHLDEERLGALFKSAYVHHRRRADIVTLHANYLLNVAGRHAEAEPFLQEAVARDPRNVQMWTNLVRYQFAVGRFAEAEAGLSRLRDLNRFGRHDAVIAELAAMRPTTKQGPVRSGGVEAGIP